MAYDGLTMRLIALDIEKELLGARVDKLHLPTRDELLITFRTKGLGRIFVSINPNGARVSLTGSSRENPASPPMFCMLLRKHLLNSKLIRVTQQGLDRVLHLTFECTNELGDKVEMSLVLEIMGRMSNVILLKDGRVVDALKRVTAEQSGFRQILPGIVYVSPPAQERLNLLAAAPEQILDTVKISETGTVSKALLSALEGVSPLLCRELAYQITRGDDDIRALFVPDCADRFVYTINKLKSILQTGESTPTMVLSLGGEPKDYSFIPVGQYGGQMLTKEYDNLHTLLDRFYEQKDLGERVRAKGGDLLKQLVNLTDRTTRRIAVQSEELLYCREKEQFKLFGDLINANLYRIPDGAASATLENYYDEGKDVTVTLDPTLTPVQNAQKYYAAYRRAISAESVLTKQIESGREELFYLESVFDALTRAGTDEDILAIKEELAAGGYVKRVSVKRGQKPRPLSPLKFVSEDGFTVLVGRNNVMNDTLTLKTAQKTDLWLHTQKIPGSHVIVQTGGQKLPNATIEFAARLAARYSKAGSAKVAVDYTLVKNVKKPAGARPGMVIYDNYNTAYVPGE